MGEADDILLKVENLSVEFTTGGSTARAVRDVSFSVPKGKTVGLVGESGCGKSVSSMSLMGLIPSPPGRVAGGKAFFDGRDIFSYSAKATRDMRGRDMAMIFQEPMTSLNPVFTIGNQLTEALFAHEKISMQSAWERSVKELSSVGISSPDRCMGQYPHELSGGMKQRVMIAMALLCRPKMLIADEPTTALDVTIQAQILDLLRRLQQERAMSMLFITHDLGVVAEMAHEVCVMYAGRMVEKAQTSPLFAEPMHPYTQGLFKSLPSLTGDKKKLYTIPGMVPSPANLPKGCPFRPRCEKALDVCAEIDPELEEKIPGRMCACHAVKKGGE